MSERRRHESDGEGGNGRRTKKQRIESMKGEIQVLQEQLQQRDERINHMQEDIEVLRRQIEDRQDADHQALQAADGNAPPSKSDIKLWKKEAQNAGRRAASLHAPFLDVDSLGGHQVQENLEQILNDVQKAKDEDSSLEDDDKPARFFDFAHFDIPDPVETTRELVFHLLRSPGNLWLDEWFQDALKLGARKQRGDLVHAIAKYHEKIFDITDPRFEDRRKRADIPQVQNMSHTFMHTGEDDPVEDFFKDKIIVWVLRLLLNGPSAIRTGRRSPKSRKAHVDMWHVKIVTPSLLAFAATAIKFVLSGQPSFEEVSGETNYTKWYLSRLGLLEGLYADEPDA
ncbi:hypothetical protein FRC07_009350 [Ceratobasidium sp. 392]|nr:hypothetical protein FRC07_009350 [Ceratobasidium sp. 392]